MFLKRITASIPSVVLAVYSLVSGASAMEATETREPMPLHEALKRGEQVALFNVNDAFTDADSIQAFLDSLILASEYKDLVTQYFVTDDESDLATAQKVLEVIKDPNGRCLKDTDDEEARQNYFNFEASNPTAPKFAYRAQDTATVLFPLAKALGVPIKLFQGEVGQNPWVNPYFGNFGRDFSEADMALVDQIEPNCGSAAVIEAIKAEIALGKRIYVLNGGSFRLLTDIQEMAPTSRRIGDAQRRVSAALDQDNAELALADELGGQQHAAGAAADDRNVGRERDRGTHHAASMEAHRRRGQ